MLRTCSDKTANIVVGLTQPWLKPMIYRTRVEQANHYTTDAVDIQMENG